MNMGYIIKTTDMHTAGEPLRIIESIEPAVEIKGTDILDKILYLKTHLDWIRKLIIDEPRGHRDMYGALILESTDHEKYEFGVIFMHNDGYSTMCGHGVIALARYAVEKKLLGGSHQNIRIMCPCGIVECSVSEVNSVVMSTFLSVPSFLLERQLKVDHPDLGTVSVDISYGGAFYAIVHERDLGIKLGVSDIHTVILLADSLKIAIIKTTRMRHPTDSRLEFLYGIIILEDSDDNSDNIYRNLVVFADKEVDRSPCGSGVTAQMAALYFGNNKNHVYCKEIKFQNALLREKSEFRARIKEEIKLGTAPNEVLGAQVEVTGCAFYTGKNEFFYELNDPLKYGFRIYK